MAWFKRFYDPIILPDGRKLLTLGEAAQYITDLPQTVKRAAEWRIAMEALLLVAERDAQIKIAQIAIVNALNQNNTKPDPEPRKKKRPYRVVR